VFQLGFSQTEKLIQGKILCENLLLQGIEVLNLASKRTTITNTNGRFSILAKAKDTLMFIEFKELVKKTNDENYYLEILKLKPDELGLFIEFCDADPKSKTILENTNPLSLMDFLLTKNVEFKKLPTIEK
jgi:hypothetical protein